MSDEDKAWLREIFKRSRMARKLGATGQFTEEEQRRWERLYEMYLKEYEQLVEESKHVRI